LQISRPRRIRPMCSGVLRSSGTEASSSRCARSAEVFGTSPSRVATRWTWCRPGSPRVRTRTPSPPPRSSDPRPAARTGTRRSRRPNAGAGRPGRSAPPARGSRAGSPGSWRLRVGQAAGTDRVGELGGRGADHVVPRRVSPAQQPERALGVQVARVLRLDGQDQLVERIGLPRRREVAEVSL
jgi:hypothetical protein